MSDVDTHGPISAVLETIVDDSMEGSDRTLYATSKKIGVSDIGGCHEYVRRLISDEDFTDPRENFMAAFMGTAFGDHFEQAYLKWRNPDAIVQSEVVVELALAGGAFILKLPGHPDIIDPALNAVIDGKTKDGLSVVRRNGADPQHRFQVVLYTKAAIDAGLIQREGATCALAYFDRSGVENRPHVVEFPYTEVELDEAIAWLDDVIYALQQAEEASKDKPRDWCWSYCPFATACRGGDTDVSGLITDVVVLGAVEAYREGHEMELKGKAMKAAAKSELLGINGQTPTLTLRWIHMNETPIRAGVRAAYDRIDLRARKDIGR